MESNIRWWPELYSMVDSELDLDGGAATRFSVVTVSVRSDPP